MPSLTESEFVASDGRRIALKEGWFEQKRDWPGADDFKGFADLRGTRACYPTDDTFFLSELMTANTVYGLLRQHGFRSVNGPMLDICTGPAILPRAFRALSICTEAYGIDVLDRSMDYPDDRMARWWSALPTIIEKGKGDDAFKLFAAMGEIQTGLNNVFGFLNTTFDRQRLGIDGYSVGDFLDYAPHRQFPLVTLAAGLENFDSAGFFEKLSRTMAPSGIFVTFNDYFYDVWGAAMHLPMDAPWLHARLTRDDLIRYYETLRPEIVESVKKAMYFPSTHKTVADYAEDARRHGLQLVFHRRAMNKLNIKEMLFSSRDTINDFHDVILKDCLVINPTVVSEDLFTGILTMVFRKPA